jgi:hypothetical protein
MQAAGWIALFQRIPAEQHDTLMLMTATGAEIVLQRIVRLEGDFMIAVGRLSGSTDQGRLLIIPFDQLTYISFNKKLSDEEIETSIGQPAAATLPPQSGAAAPLLPAKKPETAAPVTSNSSADTPMPADHREPPAAKPTQKSSPPSKSVLLARLRQRLADDISKRLHQ